MHHASAVNVLANAMYDVLSIPGEEGPERETKQTIKQAFLDYMRLGGACLAGPIHLLAALSPAPGLLTAHFLTIVGRSVSKSLLPFPTPASLK